MAIRSGTGGLKYPLPNQAQINAQQSAAAASAGGSASASAYSANRQFSATKMRVQADLANAAAERQQRSEQANLDRGFRAQQEYYDREHQKGAQLEGQRFRSEQEELDRNFAAYRQMQGQNFQSNQSQLDRDFTTQRDQARFEHDEAAFEAKRDAGIEEGIRGGKLELSPEAQMRMQKIEADRAAIAAQDHLTPEQKAEFESKAEAKRREILRTARPPQAPSPTDAANKGTTYYDPQQGKFAPEMGPGRTPGRVNEKGEFQPIVEQPDTSKQDAKRLAEEEKRAREYMKDAEETGKSITPEAAMKKARNSMLEEQAGFDRARNGHPPMLAPGQQAPQPPAPGQPPAYRPSLEMPVAGSAPPPLTQPLPEATPQGMGNSVQSRSGSYGEPPEGFPAGSKTIDFGTYLLPDGRIIRAKGK